MIELKTLLQTYCEPVNGVLHIGAHYGQEYDVYRELNINPKVLIEPLPTAYDFLVKKTSSDQNCICINTAVGNMVGSTEMYVEEENLGQSSSILKPKLHLMQFPYITFSKTIKVPITKIDLLDIPKCNFINLDVQGYELEVLKGAKNYLNTVKYIVLEVNRDEVYENCALINDVDMFLRACDFKQEIVSWYGGCWGAAFYEK